MTPEREKTMTESVLDSNLVSSTECTGMLPAIADYDTPDAMSAATDVPRPVIAALEDPARSPLTGGSEHLYGGHSRPMTTPGVRPAKAPGPYHPGSGRNP